MSKFFTQNTTCSLAKKIWMDSHYTLIYTVYIFIHVAIGTEYKWHASETFGMFIWFTDIKFLLRKNAIRRILKLFAYQDMNHLMKNNLSDARTSPPPACNASNDVGKELIKILGQIAFHHHMAWFYQITVTKLENLWIESKIDFESFTSEFKVELLVCKGRDESV